ncbi:MAG: carbonic anhydrase [Cloacibacterium sp.]|jgi:carbonic anhydrase|nr:carbonic anhydrase [Cloacibacterium sp.]
MNRIKLIFSILALGSLAACSNTNQKAIAGSKNNTGKPKALVQDVLTKEQRDALTPEQIIQSFKDGNERYIKKELTARDHSQQIRKSATGQYPKAVVLSCLDSRVPVEDVFDKGIGDIFVGRVAGNFVNEDLLGSMEFGCKVAGAKVILVLGHEHCGAIKSAIDDVKLGNITAMLSKIRPAVEKAEYSGERNSKNEEFVHKVCESNVKHTIEQIRAKSAILKEMENKGEIKIIGGIYDLDSGKVSFLE